MTLHSSPGSRDLRFPLDRDLREALAPWADMAALSTPVPMHLPPPSVVIMTDASCHGWSGWPWPDEACGSWGPDALAHSMNWLELTAVHLTLLHFSEQLRVRSVKVLSDNSTVVACLHCQGSVGSPLLWELSRDLGLDQGLGHPASSLPPDGVLNVLAGVGSRSGPISTDWSLGPRSFGVFTSW